ncbi:MAG: ATPase domain-containing protein [Microvirga sp.]
MSDRLIEKLATAIPGLDTILHGGLPRGGIYIVQGTPGSGKTILGNQLCFNHAVRGGRALYVTLLAETHGRMLSHIGQLGFFDETHVPDGVSYLSAFRILETEGLKGLTDALRREIRARRVDLLILDGLVSAEETAGTPREFKKFISELQIQADLADCTMVLLTSAAADQGFASAEHTMVDGLIEIQRSLRGRRSERTLQVHKLRGSGFLEGVHFYQVTGEGIVVHPRIEAMLTDAQAVGTGDGMRTSTGVPMLDDMMGGGPSLRSTTLAMGSAGTGKTTLALHFLGAEDEPGLYLSFNETPAAIRQKAESFKLPAAGMLASGQIEVIWQPPTEGTFDEVVTLLLRRIAARNVKRVVIDGVDDFGGMTGDPERTRPVLTALANRLAAMQVTLLATSEIDLSGVIPAQPLAGLFLRGLSPFAENIVVMRFAALEAEVYRLAVVLKARESFIDLRFRHYDIGPRGIEVDRDFERARATLTRLAGHPGGRHDGPGPAAPFTDPGDEA